MERRARRKPCALRLATASGASGHGGSSLSIKAPACLQARCRSGRKELSAAPSARAGPRGTYANLPKGVGRRSACTMPSALAQRIGCHPKRSLSWPHWNVCNKWAAGYSASFSFQECASCSIRAPPTSFRYTAIGSTGCPRQKASAKRVERRRRYAIGSTVPSRRRFVKKSEHAHQK